MTKINESAKTGKIAFQGAHGAFSDMSCRAVFPGMETVPPRLQRQPEQGIGAEHHGAANGRVGRDTPVALDNFVQTSTRNAEQAGCIGLAQRQRLEKVLFQKTPRVLRAAQWHACGKRWA